VRQCGIYWDQNVVIIGSLVSVSVGILACGSIAVVVSAISFVFCCIVIIVSGSVIMLAINIDVVIDSYVIVWWVDLVAICSSVIGCCTVAGDCCCKCVRVYDGVWRNGVG